MVRIGRAADNQVVLYSAVVSRYHVELQIADAAWRVINLGTNGTYISGKRIDQQTAEDGMVIRLARSGPMIQIRLNQQIIEVPHKSAKEAFESAQQSLQPL